MLRHDLYERGELVTAQNFAEMQQRAELAEEQLRRIYDWCDAYPLGFGSGIFDEPDMKQVQALLGDELLTQLSAHNFRHVLNGVKAIAARNEEPII
jgi:sialic acid synthase SpsE